MNNIFSPFELLGAEMLGQSIKSPSPIFENKSSTSISPSQGLVETGDGCCCYCSKANKPSTQEKTSSSTPSFRFAMELDGIDCCETLVYS